MLRVAFCLFTRSVKAFINFCQANCTDLASAQSTSPKETSPPTVSINCRTSLKILGLSQLHATELSAAAAGLHRSAPGR